MLRPRRGASKALRESEVPCPVVPKRRYTKRAKVEPVEESALRPRPRPVYEENSNSMTDNDLTLVKEEPADPCAEESRDSNKENIPPTAEVAHEGPEMVMIPTKHIENESGHEIQISFPVDEASKLGEEGLIQLASLIAQQNNNEGDWDAQYSLFYEDNGDISVHKATKDYVGTPYPVNDSTNSAESQGSPTVFEGALELPRRAYYENSGLLSTTQPTIVYAATSTPINGSGSRSYTLSSGAKSAASQSLHGSAKKRANLAHGDVDAGKDKGYNPSPSSRNSHNEKERRRRSRMKYSCQMLRTLIPGIADKTDKATVLEHAVHYILHMHKCPNFTCTDYVPKVPPPVVTKVQYIQQVQSTKLNQGFSVNNFDNDDNSNSDADIDEEFDTNQLLDDEPPAEELENTFNNSLVVFRPSSQEDYVNL